MARSPLTQFWTTLEWWKCNKWIDILLGIHIFHSLAVFFFYCSWNINIKIHYFIIFLLFFLCYLSHKCAVLIQFHCCQLKQAVFFSVPETSTYCNLLKHMEIHNTKPNTLADRSTQTVSSRKWCMPKQDWKILVVPPEKSLSYEGNPMYSETQVRYSTMGGAVWPNQSHSKTTRRQTNQLELHMPACPPVKTFLEPYMTVLL